MTTGADAAIAFWPSEFSFAFIAASVVSVEAPVGRAELLTSTVENDSDMA
jgi:hypothetical protein